MSEYNEIGLRIRELREALGITQEELGKRCNTTKQTIYKYEQGLVATIPMSRLERIAEILCVTPAYLLGWHEPDEEELKIQTLERAFHEDGMRTLFKLSEKATAEQIKQCLQIMKVIVGQDE